MLGELERKLTALVADGVVTRPHLRVVQAPTSGQPQQPGSGVVRVGLAELTPQPVFERGQFALDGDGDAPTSRRVLPVQFMARLEFLLRPAAGPPTALPDSRARLLDDMSIVSHNLGASTVRSGKAFATAEPDPGFQVLAFELAQGSAGAGLVDNLISGELRYQGLAEIWPPGVSTGVGVMRRLDVVLAPLPIAVVPDSPAVLTGATTRLRIRDVAGDRLRDATGVRDPLTLALSIVSDLPPAQRGTIVEGDAGAATGVRIVPLSEPETIVTYRAPAGDLGSTRLEVVAVHLATPEQETGLFLGSATLQLVPGGP